MRYIKDHYVRDLIIGVSLIVLLYALGMIFWPNISEFISNAPILKDIYSLASKELGNRSILGLSIITFFGALFIFGYPAELLFIVYGRYGYPLLLIAGVMFIATMLAQVLNYYIGFFIEKKILKDFVGKKRKDYMTTLKKYDITFIVIFNILPLPADVLTVLLGMVKYDVRKAMLFTAIGKVLKFLFLIILMLLLNHYRQ